MQKKQPLYIGVFVQNQKDAYDQIHKYVIDCLKDIHATYPDQKIVNDIDNFDKTFSKTKDAPHITTLFLGKTKAANLNQKDKLVFDQFTQLENEKHQIVLQGIVYVPGYLIAALTFPKVRCSNEYPHVTLYLSKDAKAVQSNEIIEWAFKDRKELYESKNLKVNLYHPQNAPAKYKNIYSIGKQLVLPGVYRQA